MLGLPRSLVALVVAVGLILLAVFIPTTTPVMGILVVLALLVGGLTWLALPPS